MSLFLTHIVYFYTICVKFVLIKCFYVNFLTNMCPISVYFVFDICIFMSNTWGCRPPNMYFECELFFIYECINVFRFLAIIFIPLMFFSCISAFLIIRFLVIFLLSMYIKLTCTTVFVIYPILVPVNDITRRVVMFP